MRRLFLSSMIVAIGMIATALMTSCEKKEEPIAVTGVQLSENQIIIVGGGTATLTATILPENAENKSVTWASSNTEIATIDQNGLITAIKEGTATITATTQDGGKTATCQVVVKPKPIDVAQIALTPTELTLTENGTATLTATITPENATNQAVTWASSNTEIATIDQNGLVTAIKEGTATITATTQDGGKTATCIVNVEPLVPYITMVTKKNIGEEIKLVIGVANEADKAGVWIDLNNNGEKDGDEGVTRFNSPSSYSIQSQTITLYGEITNLSCIYNQLTQLNVSENTQLTYLDCRYNQLTQLDFSKNTQLTDLDCSNNQLTQLDISKNTQLTDLFCYGNQLTQLDLSGGLQLVRLDCHKNRLTQLDVSKNTQLTFLSCFNNQLFQLDVSKNTLLTNLSCGRNQLTQLDVSKNTQLASLSCTNNQLTELNVNKNVSLNKEIYYMECFKNRLTKEAVNKLIDDLPSISDDKKGKLYLIENRDGVDGNYQSITEEQKQKAKAKRWELYVDYRHINP